MIKLNSDTFRRAIEKAQTTQPACTLLSTDGAAHTFQVARSGGGFSIVDVWPQGGTLWTSCDCAAGSGLHRRGFPQPCYHVAAAALSVGLFTQVMPLGAVLDQAPESAAAPQLPAAVPSPTPAPQAAWRNCLGKVTRWLGRVFCFARESRA